jgi:hypothetical protein
MDKQDFTYPSNALHERMMTALKTVYPGFVSWRMIVSGPPGSGKSTVEASFPVPDGKNRYFADAEDSMAYLDGGKDCADWYAPRKQRFHMVRVRMPDLGDYAKMYSLIVKDAGQKLGVFGIDNIAIMQDTIVQYLIANAGTPAQIRETWKYFGVAHTLPVNSMIEKWGKAPKPGPEFWSAAKAIPQAFLLTCIKFGVHFIGATEEGNVWENYGSPGAKVVGKKAKIWDVWSRYTDGVIFLKRDVNKAVPPDGFINVHNPKMRLQGLNAKWTMDWPHFIGELEAAAKREAEEIPEDAKAPTTILVEEPEGDASLPRLEPVHPSDNGKEEPQLA